MKSWVVYIAIALGSYVFYSSSQVDRDSSGSIVGEGSLDAFNMRVGDCFNDDNSSVGETFEVTDVPGVPCSDPHDNEVYAVFDLKIDSFPENDAMPDLAFDACLKQFHDFVGKDYETSSLDILTMYPTSSSWTQQNDKEVICAVYDVDLKKLEGSMRSAGI